MVSVVEQIAGSDWTKGDTELSLQISRKKREAEKSGVELDHEQAERAVIEEVRRENLARKRKTSDVRVVNPDMKWQMWRIAELEERFVVGESPLSAAEVDELKDLRGRYPEIAADVDKLDHRYRYLMRREEKISGKAGLHWLDGRRVARAKYESLRDRNKRVSLIKTHWERGG